MCQKQMLCPCRPRMGCRVGKPVCISLIIDGAFIPSRCDINLRVSTTNEEWPVPQLLLLKQDLVIHFSDLTRSRTQYYEGPSGAWWRASGSSPLKARVLIGVTGGPHLGQHPHHHDELNYHTTSRCPYCLVSQNYLAPPSSHSI